MPQLIENKSRWVARVNLAGLPLHDQYMFVGAFKTNT